MTRDKRLRSIDELRGFAIGSMILVNFLAFYTNVPGFLKHAKGIGYNFADVVAPLFMFILGLMYRKSIVKRTSTEGKIKAWLHFIKRYGLILFIGFIGNFFARGSLVFEWGVLQTIGMSGIIVLPLIGLPLRFRVLSGLVILVVYQFVIAPNYYNNIVNIDHGGVIGAISWSTIILFSSYFGDSMDMERKNKTITSFVVYGVITFIIGLLLSNIVPISKQAVSLSYIILSIGLSALFLVLFIIINDFLSISIPTLKTIGQNALLIYLLHYALIKIGHLTIPKSSTFNAVILVTVLIYLIIFSFGWLLAKRGIYFRV